MQQSARTTEMQSEGRGRSIAAAGDFSWIGVDDSSEMQRLQTEQAAKMRRVS